eukprot:COSAG06_NODE_38830_length_419_cov_0.975000_1_plen_33_part_10
MNRVELFRRTVGGAVGQTPAPPGGRARARRPPL